MKDFEEDGGLYGRVEGSVAPGGQIGADGEAGGGHSDHSCFPVIDHIIANACKSAPEF